MKANSNIISFNPSLRNIARLTENDIFNTCYDKWLKIPRACNTSKTIVNEAIWFIAAIEFLFLRHPDEVIFTYDLLRNKTVAGKKQINRYLKQIAKLYNIKRRKKYFYRGKFYEGIFTATRIANSLEILADPKLFYEKQKAKTQPTLESNENGQICPKTLTKRTNLSVSLYRVEEGIEDIPQGYISSIPLEKKEYACAGNIETTPVAALPNLRGSSTGEFLIQPLEAQVPAPIDPAKTSKPRLVITAAMQTGRAKLPLPLQASGLGVGGVSTIATKPVPVPVPLLTAEQEREQQKAHQTRRQGTVSDEPKTLGATILSLLPVLGLEANSVTKTHQKGVEFQLAVENSEACSTLEPSIEPRVTEQMEPKTEREVKPTDLDDEFRCTLAEKAETKAVWQALLSGVTDLMDEIHDPLSGKMRVVAFEDIRNQFVGMNYKVDLEAKRIRLQAKGELWIPAFELVYSTKFKDASAGVGYSFELVKTMEGN
jgi:hypothetical protein